MAEVEASKHNPKGVVVVGLGAIGQQVVRLLLERGWPVAAALNRSGPKVGQDLGAVCGLGREVGIIVADEKDFDPGSVEADIAVIASTDRIRLNMPVYRRFLGAGMNVLCVGCESSWPWAASRELAAEIDVLARRSGVTFTGSGFQDVHRHWIGRALIGTCTSLRGFLHESHTDIAPHGVETARLVRAGMSVAEFDDSVSGVRSAEVSIYRVFFEQLARSLPIEIESVEEQVEPCVKDVDLHCPALRTTIPAGFVSGTRYKTIIRAKGGIVGIANNELRLFEAGEEPKIRWEVDGAPPARVEITGFDSYQGTAAPLVNRIPDVLSAAPGLVTIDRMAPPRFHGNPTVPQS